MRCISPVGRTTTDSFFFGRCWKRPGSEDRHGESSQQSGGAGDQGVQVVRDVVLPVVMVVMVTTLVMVMVMAMVMVMQAV